MGIQSLCPAHNSPDDLTANRHSQLQLDVDECGNHFISNFCVLVGSTRCTSVTVTTLYTIQCVLGSVSDDGSGSEDVIIVSAKDGGSRCSKDVMASLPEAVSYKKSVNYREMFDHFMEYGVGGLGHEVDELYRRAFASRGTLCTLYTVCTCTYICICIYISTNVITYIMYIYMYMYVLLKTREAYISYGKTLFHLMQHVSLGTIVSMAQY